MKIRTQTTSQGNTLLVTLMMATIIGIALASYLTLVSNQSISVLRSQAWNSAIPITEAGIEEALTQIQYHGITNLSADGWTGPTNGWYYKQRYVDNTSYYQVSIQQADPPVIVSTSYVPRPQTACSQLGMILAQVVSQTSPTPTYTKRCVRVNTIGGSSMGAAVISKGPIYLSGNNVTIDSFDSNDSTYSTSGKWDPSKPAKDNGDVLTNAGDGVTSQGKPLYALDVGDADIKGHVTTGPNGTVHLTSGGSVGDSAWVNAGTSGVESGWQSNDANVDVQDVQQPFTNNYSTPGGLTIGHVKYTYYLDQSANYKLSTLSGKVLVTGNATLWVTDDVNIGTGDFIEIAPGASLKLYVSAPSAVIGGQGVVNTDGHAKDFQYFGLPTNTAFTFKGNSAFVGTVNAPEADVKLGGGGTTDYDFIGSAVVKTLTMNGHFHIHYDEALRPATSGGFVVSSWTEVNCNAPLN